MRSVRLSAKPGDDPIEIKLDRVTSRKRDPCAVSIGEKSVKVEWVGDAARGWIRIDERIAPFRTVRRDDRVLLWVDGKPYEFVIAPRTAQRAAGGTAASATGDLAATMPGTVLAIKVMEGEAVERGQPIIIMESMKMELTIAAPASGTVREITCRSGELVEKGTVLARLDLEN